MKKYLCSTVLALACATMAQAAPITYTAVLTGAAESPANASPGTGFATVIIDTAAHTLDVSVSFADLMATTTASHIHCCTAVPGASTAGVATVTPTFTGFPTGVTAGVYNHLFDLSSAGSWNAAFIAGHGGTAATAEAALAAGLAGGQAYLNIHSGTFPGGEIRGFLEPKSVPEPATLSLLGLGLAGVAAARRRRA